MGFFGEVITQDKLEIPIPDGHILKILMACLPSSSLSSVLFVQTANETQGFALCCLDKKTGLHTSLQHEFGPEDSPIVFWALGSEIHLTGNWIWDEEDDENDYEEGGEHSVEEVVETTQEVVEVNTGSKKRSRKDKQQLTDSQENPPTSTSTTPKKLKKTKNPETTPTPDEPAPAIIISKPPRDSHQTDRPIWTVRPINDEGLLLPTPHQRALSSGVLISDYVIGKGNEPRGGSTISITYEGMFPTGHIFDKNLKRSKPLKFRKGTGQVIRGLDLGIEGMKVGGSREIVIPAALGYGEDGVGDIPGNQTLVFRVTLIGVENRRR